MSTSKLAQNLKGSEIIKIAAEINELKKKGEHIANLTIGDFDSNIFPIPDGLKARIVKAYDSNQTNYPPAEGVLDLRESVSAFLAKNYKLDYPSGQILISGGSRPLIYATYLALVDPGDTVVYPAPSWNNNHYCDFTGAKGIAVPTSAGNNFMPTASDLRPHLKGAAMLSLCSPLNPTGTMFSKLDLEEICDLVIEENKSRKENERPLYILYDQIYSQLTFGDHKHFDPVTLRPELKDYVVFIDGSSKCFASTGVRVGWGFGPPKIMNAMKAIIMHIGAWAPKAEQVAMAEFLKDSDAVTVYLNEFKQRIRKSLDALYTGFKQLKNEGFNVDAIEPMGAIYLTVKMDLTGKVTPGGKTLSDSADINFYIIKEARGALVPFSAFGTDDKLAWFRASVGACSYEDIEALIPRIRKALKELN